MKDKYFIEFVKYLLQALGLATILLSLVTFSFVEKFNDYLILKNGKDSCGVRMDEVHKYTVVTRESAGETDWVLSLHTKSGNCSGVFKIKSLLDATLEDLGDRTIASQTLNLNP